MSDETVTRTVIEPTADDVTSVTERSFTGSEQRAFGKPFPKGVSGNPNGRPRSKSLREIARERYDPATLAAFMDHAMTQAMGTSGVAVRWAQLVVDVYEANAALRVTLEATGWDAFTHEVMQRLGVEPGPDTTS